MKTDGRQLHRKALDAIRTLALQRIAAGETVTAVMQSYGLCRTTVYKWQRKLRARGGSVLAIPYGRKRIPRERNGPSVPPRSPRSPSPSRWPKNKIA